VKLGILPSAIDDIVVLEQHLRAGTVHAGGAAIGDAIPPHDVATRAGSGWPGGVRPFIGPAARVDSHRIDLAHRIPFDDPVMPAPGGESGAPEAIGAVLQYQSADPDEAQAHGLGLNKVLLHGGFEEPAIRVGVFKGMNMEVLPSGATQ